jgi:hypothetical protein
MDEVARMCARLLVHGTLPRRDLPELQHPVLRSELEERLRMCGLALATSAYSDHVGLRLAEETSDASVLDAPSNLGLGADACALLTILWARLALQKRTAEDTRRTPSAQGDLLPEDQRAASAEYAPAVRFETLVREFGTRLGGRVHMKALVGRLRRLGFVRYDRLDAIQSGPLLDLGIDGERMVSFIRSRVLAQLLEARRTSEAGAEVDGAGEAGDGAPDADTSALTDRVLRALETSDGPASIGELERSTGLARTQLRGVLRDLRVAGRVDMVGERAAARYSIRRAKPSSAARRGSPGAL